MVKVKKNAVTGIRVKFEKTESLEEGKKEDYRRCQSDWRRAESLTCYAFRLSFLR